jgi:hypothetical protein
MTSRAIFEFRVDATRRRADASVFGLSLTGCNRQKNRQGRLQRHVQMNSVHLPCLFVLSPLGGC